MKKRNKFSVFLLLFFALTFCLGIGAAPAYAAGDALSVNQIRTLLNNEPLHPQPTGYAELDARLEQILAPYADSDTYTKIKALYDWTVKNIDYSWEGYSKTTAPAYDCFTCTYNLTYDDTLKQAFPREIIDRSYHALTAHKGVCYDWGALFAVMARYVGIEAYVHTGYFRFEAGYGSGSGHHGWTELKLNGKNYIFDGQREYRLCNDGRGAIQYLYFGIPYENAWRYSQETYANAQRDAGFLPVTADRLIRFHIDAVASRSGSVSGGGEYPIHSRVTLTNTSDVPLVGWFNESGNLLSTANSYRLQAERDTTVYALYLGDHFCDISGDAWYLDAAVEAYERNIINGVTPVHFRGSQTMTRAMAATIIANGAGADLDGQQSTFRDVPRNAWYAEAVGWAAEQGIVNGISAQSFQPNGSVTREQLTTMIVRYLEQQGLELPTADLQYNDVSSISPYAAETLAKAQGAGLISGYADGTLRPKATVSRAEGVVILMRALHYLETGGNQDVPEETPEETPTEPTDTPVTDDEQQAENEQREIPETTELPDATPSEQAA